MLILLLSSMIGTTVWAKPDKPGKPSRPEPEKFDYQIWIGNGPLGSPEDLVLQSYDELDHLVVENVGYSGRWLPPPTKGKRNNEGWSVGLEKSEGDYCGTYEINKPDLIAALDLNGIFDINEKDVYRFYLGHSLTSYWTEDDPRPSQADFWHIMIQFELGTFFEVPESYPPFVVPHFLVLEGNTDTGLEPEGEYDEPNDTWTVYFSEAWFRVIKNSESGEIEELWTGQLSFTVKIERTLVES